jgi:streptogramin lyase
MLKHLSSFTRVVVLLSLVGSPAWADITEFEVPTPSSGPGGIIVGPDGNLWFGEQFKNRIGRFNLADSTITEFELPNPNSLPRGLAVGADNNVWFGETNGNRIGRITVDGNITEFDLPTPNSGPFGGTLGPDGNYWFTENLGSGIGRITPQGDIVEFPIPTANSQPRGIIAGPDGNLWFTEYTGNQIETVAKLVQVQRGDCDDFLGKTWQTACLCRAPKMPGLADQQHAANRREYWAFWPQPAPGPALTLLQSPFLFLQQA